MRNLITIILILISSISIGQNKNQFKDTELICEQINSATDYLRNDRNLKVTKIKFDQFIRDGWNYDSFASDYISYKFDVPKKEIFDIDTEKTNRIYKKIGESTYNSGHLLELDCLKKRTKPNSIISKIDEDTMIIRVTEKRLGREGSNGKLYLFIFDNSKIKNVLEKGWIN